MAGENNKIMTVSYGTFSCTLEGFDDPFGTMREMAEYFRDLAAQDRFFGAEPPQPDVDTLHRIAEQTVQQQITSEHVAKDNLVLRQVDPSESATNEQSAPAQQTQAPAPEPTQAANPAPADSTGGSSPLASAVVGMPTAAEIVQSGKGDSVAEKLQRIRSVVTNDTEALAGDTIEDPANDFMTRSRRNLTRIVPEIVSGDYYDDMQDVSVPAAKPSDITETEDDDEEQALLEKQDDADFEEVQRLASGVTLDDSQADFDETEILSLDEDGNLEDPSLSQRHADTSDLTAKETLVSRSPVEVDEISREDIAPVKTKASPTIEAVEPAAPEPADVKADIDNSASDDSTQIDLSEDDDQALREEVEDLNRDDQAKAPQQYEVRAQAEEQEKPKEAEKSSLPPVDSMMSGAFRDFRERFVDGENPEDNEFTFEDAVSKAKPKPAEPAPTQKPEEVAVEKAEQDAPQDDPKTVADAVNNEVEVDVALAAKQARREAMTEDEDSALERLMNATSSRLKDSESSGRRASIAHLKAAVAATKADSSLVEDAAAKEAAEMDRYREDLARVVRPGKSSQEESKASLEGAAPSPLVLVSEHRVENRANGAGDEIRPRRVSATDGAASISTVQDTADGVADFEDDTNIFSETENESFASYIERHKATELPDLLEAAAAHYSFVEGVEQFTRPMLMRKISSNTPERELSREDGLRAFGTLLREGKILKDEDGKFVISSNSRFMQEERFAGQ